MSDIPSPLKSWSVFFAALCAAAIVLVAGLGQRGGHDDNRAAYPYELAPHRALYSLSLSRLHSGSQVVDVQGQMVYEFLPDCEGSLTQHSFDVRYGYVDRPAVRSQNHFSLYESHNGQQLDFITQRKAGGKLYQTLRGQADLGRGRVVFSQPEGEEQELAEGALFPVAHTRALLDVIQKGGSHFNAPLYDGSDLQGATGVNVVIGGTPPPYEGENTDIDAALLGGPASRVHIGFFPQESADFAAEYEMSAIFHHNGVMRNIEIAYDDFAIRQDLIALEALEPVCTP